MRHCGTCPLHFQQKLVLPHGMRRPVVYCFLWVTPSTKPTNFGRKYLVQGLPELDEIWEIDTEGACYTSSPRLVNCGQRTPLERQNSEGCKTYCNAVWPSAIQFGTMTGVAGLKRYWWTLTYCSGAEFSTANISHTFRGIHRVTVTYFFISYLCQLFFRHVVGQALQNVPYSDITFL